jgi:hypothetical protein
VTRPSTTEDGLYASALCFGELRVMAVLGALVGFVYLVAGFANRQLLERVGRCYMRRTVAGRPPTIYVGTSGKG